MYKKTKHIILMSMFILCTLFIGQLVSASTKRMEMQNSPFMMPDSEASMAKGDANIHFLTEMIMHHQGAINMSKKEIEKGSNEKVKQLAQNMINVQAAEIQEMIGIRERLRKDTTTSQETNKEYFENHKAIKKQFMELMKNINPTSNVDKDFLEHMKVHHQEGIEMSNNILRYTQNEPVKSMANKIIKEQTTEIQIMNELLKQVQ